MYTVANLARKSGSFTGAPHCYFLYGRDVLNWAGALARWIFPRAGGIAVSNVQQDPNSIEAIRGVLRTTRHPLAFAPDGQVTYRMNTVAQTTAGAGIFAWWCREKVTEKPSLPVVFVPIGLGYLYRSEERVLRQTLRLIARATGTGQPDRVSDAPAVRARPIVETIGVFQVLAIELTRTDAVTLPGDDVSQISAGDLRAAHETLCDALLCRGEKIMQLSGEGSFLARLFRLRHTALASVYRRDGDRTSFSHARAAAADLAAECGPQADRFYQIVDVLINRINAGSIETRRTPRGREAIVTIGAPFHAGERTNEGATRRKYAASVNRQTVAALEAVRAKLRGIVLSRDTDAKRPNWIIRYQ